MTYDVIVIGGGIVGIATARQLTCMRPGISVAVIEAESKLAAHQTGNNSGVIHSGLYYRPDSDKARNCVAGREMMFNYCLQNQIRVERCGKIVVAVDAKEIPGLDALYKRGIKNGLGGLKLLTEDEILEYEPSVMGIRAIWGSGNRDRGLQRRYGTSGDTRPGSWW